MCLPVSPSVNGCFPFRLPDTKPRRWRDGTGVRHSSGARGIVALGAYLVSPHLPTGLGLRLLLLKREALVFRVDATHGP